MPVALLLATCDASSVVNFLKNLIGLNSNKGFKPRREKIGHGSFGLPACLLTDVSLETSNLYKKETR